MADVVADGFYDVVYDASDAEPTTARQPRKTTTLLQRHDLDLALRVAFNRSDKRAEADRVAGIPPSEECE